MNAKTTKVTERGMWSAEEHDKFLVGLKMYPKGPWKLIAAQVGTRSSRQVQTHAQKYYEKVARRLRGLRKDRKKLVRPEHRLDEDMMKLCKVEECGTLEVAVSPIRRSVKVVTASPTSVDADSQESGGGDALSEAVASKEHPEPFASLWTEDHPVAFTDASDSDDMDPLMDFDDFCLDFLIEALHPSDSASDGSWSE